MKEPKIRFTHKDVGFEKYHLCDIASINPKTNVPTEFEYVDLESVSGTEMISHRTEKKSTAPSRAQRLAKYGDIFYQTVRPYQKNNYYFDIKADNYVFSTGYAQIRSSINGKYLFTLLQSDAFLRQVLDNCSGTSFPAINPSTLSKLIINICTDSVEQERVATFFTSLDAQISASTSRLASLKQMKAASLQAMFPQEGETVPEVRFKGFEGEWNKAVVGKIGYTYSGLSGKSKDDFGTGNAQFITFMNVLNNAQIDTSILDFVEVRISEHQNEVRKGDLFFNTSSETPEEVGMCAVLKEDVNNVYLNSFCFGFRLTDDSVYPSYIAYLMRSNIGRHIMSILAQGATRYNLSKNNFCQTEIPMPCKKEQQSIASFFTSLDRQIALHAKRLEKLKQIKATCLDKMFV